MKTFGPKRLIDCTKEVPPVNTDALRKIDKMEKDIQALLALQLRGPDQGGRA